MFTKAPTHEILSTSSNEGASKLGGGRVLRVQWRAVALLVGGALVFGVALGWAIAGSGGAAPPAPAPVGMRLPTTKNAEWEAFIMHSCDDGQFQLTMNKDAEGEYIGGWVVDDEDGHPSKRIMGTERCAAHSDDAATSPVTVLDDQTVAFVVIGDFGRDGFCCQHDVAKEMALAAEKLGTNRTAGVRPGVIDAVINGARNHPTRLRNFDCRLSHTKTSSTPAQSATLSTRRGSWPTRRGSRGRTANRSTSEPTERLTGGRIR